MAETPSDFPAIYRDKIRFSDTDMLGHVNNLAFAGFFEGARAEILLGETAIAAAGCFFVLANSAIDFTGELNFPGEIMVGTAISRIGTSSASFRQAIFQNGDCAARSNSTMVQIDGASRSAAALSPAARNFLGALACNGG